MPRSPDQVKVGELVSPASLTYFASVKECREFLENERSRARLEKKWRERYSAHNERTKATMRAKKAAERAA